MKPTQYYLIFAPKIIAVAILAVLITSCINSQLSSSSKIPKSDNLMPGKRKIIQMNLTDMLRSIHNVTVNGHNEFARVSIRNNIGRMPAGNPVYIVNGNIMGTDYMTVYRTIDHNSIVRMKALNDASALSTFGQIGSNGAIIIETSFGNRN